MTLQGRMCKPVHRKSHCLVDGTHLTCIKSAQLAAQPEQWLRLDIMSRVVPTQTVGDWGRSLTCIGNHSRSTGGDAKEAWKKRYQRAYKETPKWSSI